MSYHDFLSLQPFLQDPVGLVSYRAHSKAHPQISRLVPGTVPAANLDTEDTESVPELQDSRSQPSDASSAFSSNNSCPSIFDSSPKIHQDSADYGLDTCAMAPNLPFKAFDHVAASNSLVVESGGWAITQLPNERTDNVKLPDVQSQRPGNTTAFRSAHSADQSSGPSSHVNCPGICCNRQLEYDDWPQVCDGQMDTLLRRELQCRFCNHDQMFTEIETLKEHVGSLHGTITGVVISTAPCPICLQVLNATELLQHIDACDRLRMTAAKDHILKRRAESLRGYHEGVVTFRPLVSEKCARADEKHFQNEISYQFVRDTSNSNDGRSPRSSPLTGHESKNTTRSSTAPFDQVHGMSPKFDVAHSPSGSASATWERPYTSHRFDVEIERDSSKSVAVKILANKGAVTNKTNKMLHPAKELIYEVGSKRERNILDLKLEIAGVAYPSSSTASTLTEMSNQIMRITEPNHQPNETPSTLGKPTNEKRHGESNGLRNHERNKHILTKPEEYQGMGESPRRVLSESPTQSGQAYSLATTYVSPTRTRSLYVSPSRADHEYANELSRVASTLSCTTLCDSSDELEDCISDSDSDFDMSPPDTPDTDSPAATVRSVVRTMLSSARTQVIEGTMSDFYPMFDSSEGIRSHAGSESPSNESTTNPTQSGSSAQGGESSKKRSHQRRASKSQNDDEEDDQNKRRRVESGEYSNSPLSCGLRFACPYHKRNPSRHSSKSSCVFPGFRSLSRLKEHLYRTHARPISCPRCYHTFRSDEDLGDHLNAFERCEPQTQEARLLDGFTRDQERMIRSRKWHSAGSTDEDKWKALYHILFPEVREDEIPSPYCDHRTTFDTGKYEAVAPDELAPFEKFSRTELPRLVRNDLEVIVDNMIEGIKKSLEEHLKSQLGDLVRDCQAKLLPLYRGRQLHQPLPSPFLGNSNIIDRDPNDCGDQGLESQISPLSATHERLSRFFVPPPPASNSLAGVDLQDVRGKAPMHAGSASSGPSRYLSDSGYSSTMPDFLSISKTSSAIERPLESTNSNQPFESFSDSRSDKATHPDQYPSTLEDLSDAWPYADCMDEPHLDLNGFFDLQENLGMVGTSQNPHYCTNQSLPLGDTFENCTDEKLNQDVHPWDEGGFGASVDVIAGQFIDPSHLLENKHDDLEFCHPGQ